MRLRGCIRCGSDNHSGDQCVRFEYWSGPPCTTCGYLHKSSLCPRFNKDRKSDRQSKGQQKRVNTTEITEDNRQLQSAGYIPAVAQPMSGAQVVNDSLGMFPNLFNPGGSKN